MARKALRTAIGAFALLTALALVAAGCGGGGDSTTDSGGDFVAQADAICTSVNDQTDALQKPTSASDLKPYLDKAVPIATGALGDLKVLTPPAGQNAQFSVWLATLTAQAKIFEKAQSIAGSNPVAAVALVKTTGPLAAKGDQQAAALGLKVCSKDSSGGSSG